jgi:hypothetical protein
MVGWHLIEPLTDAHDIVSPPQRLAEDVGMTLDGRRVHQLGGALTSLACTAPSGADTTTSARSACRPMRRDMVWRENFRSQPSALHEMARWRLRFIIP